MNITEHLIKGSNNLIVLTLTDSDVPISDVWTALDIYVGTAPVVHRTSNSAGITFDNGVITINPANMNEGFAELTAGRLYPVKIRVQDPDNQSGVWYGEEDSEDKLWFLVSDPP